MSHYWAKQLGQSRAPIPSARPGGAGGGSSRTANPVHQNGASSKQSYPNAGTAKRAPGLPGLSTKTSTLATAISTTRTGGAGAGLGPSLERDQQQEEAWIKARQIHQQQLLTEHFGFSPLSFVDDVINSVNNMIYQASMALQEYVEGQMEELAASNALPNSNINTNDESAKCMHKFETLLESSVDKNFDRFELYALKNLFGVPEDVDIVLPHYEALDFEIGVEREQKLDEELDYLRRQLIATKALNYKLRKELAIQENRRRQLEKCREQIRFLKDAVQEYGDVVPVPQTLIFVRDNIETLHRRFESLHEKLQQNTSRPVVTATASASVATITTNGVSAQPDSVPLALHETLVSMELDQRAIYIRSVVRRQIEEFLASDGGYVANAPPTP
ncbi:Mis12 protein-domain-containing protein [Dissophora ornata]|nr:hypothetical protein BGZ58_010013 [Dissophora ornata]KAI8604015.1 Mis12 protein-domain-containing protein [Dissophora ornata]